MTIRRHAALQRHWEKYPPLSRLAAWYFGFGKETPKQPEHQDFAAFYQEMTGQLPPV